MKVEIDEVLIIGRALDNMVQTDRFDDAIGAVIAAIASLSACAEDPQELFDFICSEAVEGIEMILREGLLDA